MSYFSMEVSIPNPVGAGVPYRYSIKEILGIDSAPEKKINYAHTKALEYLKLGMYSGIVKVFEPTLINIKYFETMEDSENTSITTQEQNIMVKKFNWMVYYYLSSLNIIIEMLKTTRIQYIHWLLHAKNTNKIVFDSKLPSYIGKRNTTINHLNMWKDAATEYNIFCQKIFDTYDNLFRLLNKVYNRASDQPQYSSESRNLIDIIQHIQEDYEYQKTKLLFEQSYLDNLNETTVSNIIEGIGGGVGYAITGMAMGYVAKIGVFLTTGVLFGLVNLPTGVGVGILIGIAAGGTAALMAYGVSKIKEGYDSYQDLNKNLHKTNQFTEDLTNKLNTNPTTYPGHILQLPAPHPPQPVPIQPSEHHAIKEIEFNEEEADYDHYGKPDVLPDSPRPDHHSEDASPPPE